MQDFSYDYGQIHEKSCKKRELTLFFSCKDLVKLELLHKTNPKLYLFKQTSHGWDLIDKTETVQKTSNPEFTKSFVLTHCFEHKQIFKAVIINDITEDQHDKDEFQSQEIGEAQFYLRDLMKMPDFELRIKLINNFSTQDKKSEKIGILDIKGEQAMDSEQMIYLGLNC